MTGAARELTRATLPALWLSPREIVAPAYGERVFIATTAALADALQQFARDVADAR